MSDVMVLVAPVRRVFQLYGHVGYAEFPGGDVPQVLKRVVGVAEGGHVGCHMGAKHVVASGDGPGMDVVDSGDVLYTFQPTAQGVHVDVAWAGLQQHSGGLPHDWLKVRMPGGSNYLELRRLLRDNGLLAHSVQLLAPHYLIQFYVTRAARSGHFQPLRKPGPGGHRDRRFSHALS